MVKTMEKSIILDVRGNPLYKHYQNTALKEPQTAKVAGLHNLFEEHPSQRLTPQKLIDILNEAEQGNLAAQADLFRDMEEKDAHLFAEMQKRKSGPLTLSYRVLPVKNANPQEVAYAHYIAEFLDELEDFENLLLDMMDAVGHGFSNIEMTFERFGNEVFPTFDFRPQSWFMLDKDDKNKILLRTEDGKGAPLRANTWIQHRHKSRSGYIARSGLMRTLSWPYIYRNCGAQGLAELLEIYGIPIRIGKFPEGTTKADRNTLMRAVNEIGRYAGGIIPKEMEIEITQAASGGEGPFMSLTNWAEKSMSKAILGGTLTTQADGKTSTNALGVIHDEVRKDLLMTDCKQLAKTLRRDLFCTILKFNRDATIDPRRVPKIEFYDEEKEAEQAQNDASLKHSRSAALHNKKPVNDKSLRDKIETAILTVLEKKGSKQILDIIAPVLPQLAKATTEKEVIDTLRNQYKNMNTEPFNKQLADITTITQMLAMTE